MLRSIKLSAVLVIVLTIAFASFTPENIQIPQNTDPDKRQQTPGNSALFFTRGPGGHFYVEAMVDGVLIDFIVDTGASVVVLSPSDAERLGLNFDDEDYTWRFQSANGVGTAAPISINSLSLGNAQATNVEAVVIQQSMTYSLLGQSFLKKLGRIDVQGDQLTITP